jgi:two-component system nitrogen regulation sensor histidine kinase GlnL
MLASANAIALLMVACANLLIGTYVYWRNPGAAANRAFCLMGAMAAVWTIAVDLSHHSSLDPAVCARAMLASGSMLPLSTLFFVELATGGTDRREMHFSRWLVVPAGCFFLLSFTSLVVVSASRGDGILRISYGELHPAYVAYALVGFGFAARWLGMAYRSSIGQAHLHARQLLLALLIPIIIGTSTNLLVPLIFGISSLGKFGPYVSLVMIGMIAHAIIRHRLMDIRVKVRRGAVYLAAVLVAGLALLTLLVVSNALFHDDHQAPIREILLALLVAVLFAPLKGQIQRAFDRYLYREPYDYQRTIRETSRALSTTIDLPALLGHFARTVGATLRPEGLAIYLLDHEEGRFVRAHLLGHGEFPTYAAPTLPLLVELERERRLFFRDEVGQQPDGPDPVIMSADFAHLGSEVLVPLIDSDRVIGFLAVGAKRSGDPFFSDDADLLATLANQSAVAVRNAQVHHQVLLVNEHIQRILATIESGVVAVGARGRITLFNRAAESLAGVSALALRGQPVGHLPVPLARLLESTAADGESRSPVEIALPNAAGQLIPLMCSTSPLVGSQGARLGAVAVFSDLSRLKELEQEKRRAERLASLEAIASGMVHEIRNPLVSLKTFTQLLPTRFDDPVFRGSLVRVADREISRIDELLERFRTLSSAQTQPMVLLDIMDPIESTLELLRPEMEARKIRLRRVGEPPARQVPGNASQMQQLLHNLCLNALEAMSEGGELTVRVADLREAGGNYLLVEISDTGTGIPADLLDKIFNPFVTSKSRGSGLGLAICSSIADAHRATLRARNHVDRPGCTFTVEFPASEECSTAVRK